MQFFDISVSDLNSYSNTKIIDLNKAKKLWRSDSRIFSFWLMQSYTYKYKKAL